MMRLFYYSQTHLWFCDTIKLNLDFLLLTIMMQRLLQTRCTVTLQTCRHYLDFKGINAFLYYRFDWL